MIDRSKLRRKRCKCRERIQEEVKEHPKAVVTAGMCFNSRRFDFGIWKDALESKGLKVNTRKTKVMVSGSEGELYKSKIDPCGVCGRRVTANSVLCAKCEWILLFGRQTEF